MILRFIAEVNVQTERLTQQLIQRPTNLEAIAREAHAAYARGADMFVAGMMTATIKDGQIEVAAEQTRKQFSRPLQKGRGRTAAVLLLRGMLVLATTLYCSPKKKLSRKDDAPPPVGLGITLAQFGFGKGVSPGLQSRVARQVALCPSIAFAYQEVSREGVGLDTKAVKRITYQCGEGLLALRRHRIARLRSGKLKAGRQLAGKRVSVQIDG